MWKRTMTAAVCVLGCAALAVDAGAAAPSGTGPLKGRTKQGRAIRLLAHRHSIQIKHFSIQLRCRDGSALIDQESGFLPTSLNGSGRIRDHQVGNTDDVWIKGQMKGRVLHGAIRVRDRWGKVPCNSKWVRFHARH